MSKVSDIYDSFLNTLETLFPTKTYISNPYSIEDNKSPFLIDGYGLRIDEETDNSSAVFNFINTSHTFTVILTRELKRMESDATPVHDVVKLLKEDVFSLKLAIYNSIDVSTDIEIINFSSTSAVNFILTDNNSFMSIEASFLVVINEQAANC